MRSKIVTRICSVLLCLAMALAWLPSSAQAANPIGGTINVKIFYGKTYPTDPTSSKVLEDIFLGKAYYQNTNQYGGIKTYYDKPITVTRTADNFSGLSNVTVENTQLLIILYPNADLTSYADKLNTYMAGGGCLWICGENNTHYSDQNKYLNALANQLSVSYTLGTDSTDTKGSADAELIVTSPLGRQNQYGSHNSVILADANSIEPAAGSNFEPVIWYDGKAYMIDAPVKKGYLTVSADINLCVVNSQYPSAWAAQILYNMLDRSIGSIEDVASHSHSWVYNQPSPVTNTVSGCCDDSTAPACGYYNNPVSLTLDASDAAYDGQPYKAPIAAGELIHAARAVLVRTTYYDGTGAKLDTAPTVPGSYAVEEVFRTRDNQTLTVRDAFVITPGTPTVSREPVRMNNLTYNGNPQNLVYEYPNSVQHGDFVYSLDKEEPRTWNADIPTGTDAGSYTVYWKVQGDQYYSDTEVKTIAASISGMPARFTAPQAVELTYDGQSHELILPGTGTVAVGGKIEYLCYDTEQYSYTETIPAAASQGKYQIHWRFTADTNYKAPSPNRGSFTSLITIDNPTYTPPKGLTLPYTGQDREMASPGTADGGQLWYCIMSAKAGVLANGPDSYFPASGPWSSSPMSSGQTAPGTYYVYWKFVPYGAKGESAQGYVTTRILNEGEEKPAMEWTAPQARTDLVVKEDGSEQALIVPGSVVGGTMEYKLDDGGWSQDIPKAAAAKTYTVFWKATPDADHVGDVQEGQLKVTIKAADEPEKPAMEWTAPQARTDLVVKEDGSEQALIVPGSVVGGTMEYKLDDGGWSQDIPKATSAKTYTVFWRATPDADHAGGVQEGQLEVVIKAEDSPVTPPGPVTPVEPEDPVLYTVRFDAQGGTPTADQQIEEGGLVRRPADPVREGFVFQRWSRTPAGDEAWDFERNTVSGELTLYAVWLEEGYQITGIVMDANGPVSGARVRIVQGNTVFRDTITGPDGRYSFAGLPAGIYNVVAVYDGITTTILSVLTDYNLSDQNIYLSTGNTNSKLEVDRAAPDIVVGSLEQVAESVRGEADEEMESVEVKMDVSLTDDVQKPVAVQSIRAAARKTCPQAQVDLILDINVTMTLESPDGSRQDKMTNTACVLEMVIPYAMEGKRDILIHRYHDAEDDHEGAVTFREIHARPADPDVREDGTFYLDAGHDLIHIFARKFSVYAVSYTPDNPTPPQPSGGSVSPSIDYLITAKAGQGGTIQPSGRVWVSDGGSRQFTIQSDEGYMIQDVLVDGESVGAVASYRFENVRANHTIEVIFRSAQQDSLNKEEHMAYLHGFQDGLFRPNNSMTRGQAAQMFYNLLRDKDIPGKSAFTDVPEDMWCYQAVSALKELGIMVGVDADRFAPNRPITRAEFVVVISRFIQQDGSAYSSSFTDVAETDWYYRQISAAAAQGWITGYDDGSFRPGSPITRAQVTVVVNRMLERSADCTFVDSHKDLLLVFPNVVPAYWAYYDVMEAVNFHDYIIQAQGECWKGIY